MGPSGRRGVPILIVWACCAWPVAATAISGDEGEGEQGQHDARTLHKPASLRAMDALRRVESWTKRRQPYHPPAHGTRQRLPLVSVPAAASDAATRGRRRRSTGAAAASH